MEISIFNQLMQIYDKDFQGMTSGGNAIFIKIKDKMIKIQGYRYLNVNEILLQIEKRLSEIE